MISMANTRWQHYHASEVEMVHKIMGVALLFSAGVVKVLAGVVRIIVLPIG